MVILKRALRVYTPKPFFFMTLKGFYFAGPPNIQNVSRRKPIAFGSKMNEIFLAIASRCFISCHHFNDKKIIITRTDKPFIQVYIETYNTGSGRDWLSRRKNNPRSRVLKLGFWGQTD
jgi:hypothetical protein